MSEIFGRPCHTCQSENHDNKNVMNVFVFFNSSHCFFFFNKYKMSIFCSVIFLVSPLLDHKIHQLILCEIFANDKENQPSERSLDRISFSYILVTWMDMWQNNYISLLYFHFSDKSVVDPSALYVTFVMNFHNLPIYFFVCNDTLQRTGEKLTAYTDTSLTAVRAMYKRHVSFFAVHISNVNNSILGRQQSSVHIWLDILFAWKITLC